jgi:glucosamine--fructose-6-phosphate aminotransferase (isomerizing)
MCGIVGHLGPKNSVEIVLEGLARLEYRGYDSAGVSFVDGNNKLQLYKKEGKLENLRGVLADKDIVARSCIGHTRWATHGGVNDTNSHPHSNGEISLVHNGIIENASPLREMLKKEGIVFLSETDTEVFLGLLTLAMRNGADFRAAVVKAFEQVEGNSAFVVLNSATSEILTIKQGAPLVCGTKFVGSEALVSSDPYALAGMVDQLYFPEDAVLCSLSVSHEHLITFTELDGTSSKRYMSKKQDMTHDASDKGEFEHYMLKEIYEQPELIRSLTQYYFQGDGKEALVNASKEKPENVHITACGTAYYAGLVVKNYIERFNRVPVSTDLASEFRYRDPLLSDKDLGIFVSQSGETADTLAAQGLCREKNLKTLSIVNVSGSTLFRDCDHNLLIRAGVEIGVASTKAFTQQALTGRLYSAALMEDFTKEEVKVALTKKFSLLAERVDMLLARVDEIQKVAESIHNHKGFFFTGRGQYFPIALEGALKLKEIAYVHAEGYAAGELKHGPIAMIDEDMVNIALVGPELFEKTVSNIQEIKARKGVIVVIGPKGNAELDELADYFIPVDFEGLDELSPLYVNVVNQLLSYYMAKFKGTDIDKPRNLAKSVTVE